LFSISTQNNKIDNYQKKKTQRELIIIVSTMSIMATIKILSINKAKKNQHLKKEHTI